MRNPNGYGTIVKLSGNRRKPFAVRTTVGWDDFGRQIQKYIAYFSNNRDAINFLAEYNKNPLILENNMTFKEVFKKWSDIKYNKVGESSIISYNASFKHCESIHDLAMRDIKGPTFQMVLDALGDKYDMKRKVSILMKQLSKFAMENDIIAKDYSSYVDLGTKVKKRKRTIFSPEEIKLLWKNSNEPWVDTILILIYTGLRISELLELKKENFNMKELYFIGGLKTDAGRDRIIPIHKDIVKLIENRLNTPGEYLIMNDLGVKTKYSNYKREKFEVIMKNLGMQHDIHDTRHTFASMLDNLAANDVSVNKLMGHANSTIRKEVYTHKTLENLRETINMINIENDGN